MKSQMEKNEWVCPFFAVLKVTILCRKKKIFAMKRSQRRRNWTDLCHYMFDVWFVDSCLVFSLTTINNEHKNIKV